MDPRSEVLLRQAAYFTGPTLLAGLANDDLLAQLPNTHGWSWHAGDHAQLNARFAGRCHFGITPSESPYSQAVIFVPKSRELTDYLIHVISAQRPNLELFLVGEKRGGIERAAKQLAALGQARKLDSARHCQLWQVRIENAPKAREPESWLNRYTLNHAQHELTVLSLPGVFSHGRLDVGSALFLDHLHELPNGPLLDFGCGAGVLGALLKRHYPEQTVHLLDVDAFACESSRRTLAANGLEATVIAGDGIDYAPKQLAAIISNPPFHQGVHTDYQASETLLRKACEHLRHSGELRLVANSFLKYPPLIESHLGTCQTLAQGQGFKVYRAIKR